LPYYIDGDVKLTQSSAILRYIAIKNNLLGNSIEEQNRVNLVEEQLKDDNQALVRISYDPNFETLKIEYLRKLPDSLEALSKFLGSRTYFAGNSQLRCTF
jgi:glutathione S-transferase